MLFMSLAGAHHGEHFAVRIFVPDVAGQFAFQIRVDADRAVGCGLSHPYSLPVTSLNSRRIPAVQQGEVQWGKNRVISEEASRFSTDALRFAQHILRFGCYSGIGG